jgi:EAL domain-containing protein (putative c-di-GMP-specific phosphodiesterase class I)
MNATLPEDWQPALSKLEHAFQPIVSLADGGAYGYEALLRGWELAGFSSIADVFDRANADRCLYALDLELRRKAFTAFSAARLGNAKIFYNLDIRLLQMPDYSTGNTLLIAEEIGLAPARIVLELSELHEADGQSGFDGVIAAYRDQGFRIALDDFGSGYAGLKLLHRAKPDIVKIDRYFIAGSADEPQKAAFLGKIASLAHLMGIPVVAEGAETEHELRLCAEAGCNFVQGFYIARPSIGGAGLETRYSAAAIRRSERRTLLGAGTVDAGCETAVEPVPLSAGFEEVLCRFRADPELSFLAVVNSEEEPVGVYRERDFRQYVYSPFGRLLFERHMAGRGAEALLAKAPVVALGSELARVVELFGADLVGCGAVLTLEGRYAGILTAQKLLSLVARRELAEALDQNPLTRMPGNLKVDEVCSARLADPGAGVAFASLDFDDFKAFNDCYGFRNGDRVIVLFADILKSAIRRPSGFAGHMGGDDFFVSLRAASEEEALEPIIEAASRFAREAASFYSPEDRKRGWILGKDRRGRVRRVPLMTVSIAAVFVRPDARMNLEALFDALADLKREAKSAAAHRAVRVVGPTAVA